MLPRQCMHSDPTNPIIRIHLNLNIPNITNTPEARQQTKILWLEAEYYDVLSRAIM